MEGGGRRSVLIFVLLSLPSPISDVCCNISSWGEDAPLFPPSIHENVTGGLLMQYFIAEISTPQASLHLKAEPATMEPVPGVKPVELSPLGTQLALLVPAAGNCSAAPSEQGSLSASALGSPFQPTPTKKQQQTLH